MPWNKGLTKNTHPSVMKISLTMKSKGIDNFKYWREKMRALGKIPDVNTIFPPSQDVAEYMGVVLGDGNISIFPRTERLIIVSNANNQYFIKRYSFLTEKLFNKKPTVSKLKGINAIRISIYQKKISYRLKIPTGNRNRMHIIIPGWIWMEKNYIISLLKGLFEAEGSLSIHLPTCTYNFQFKNNNKYLLNAVEKGLKILGYNPEIRKNAIRLRKKKEVETFKQLIDFRGCNLKQVIAE